MQRNGSFASFICYCDFKTLIPRLSFVIQRINLKAYFIPLFYKLVFLVYIKLFRYNVRASGQIIYSLFPEKVNKVSKTTYYIYRNT